LFLRWIAGLDPCKETGGSRATAMARLALGEVHHFYRRDLAGGDVSKMWTGTSVAVMVAMALAGCGGGDESGSSAGSG
jgi:hypothetical protein